MTTAYEVMRLSRRFDPLFVPTGYGEVQPSVAVEDEPTSMKGRSLGYQASPPEISPLYILAGKA